MTELGTKADLRSDVVKVDNRVLRQPTKFTYIAMHKPVGTVTTMADPEGRPTVVDILDRVRARVVPVGRLDFHSSGLLLLTDDGELAQRLTHPRYKISKSYIAKVRGALEEKAIRRMTRGMRIDGARAQPAQVRILDHKGGKSWVEITLTEGRNREVRKMCEAVGHPVEKLRRVRIGPLKLGRMPTAAYRELTDEEVGALYEAVGM